MKQVEIEEFLSQKNIAVAGVSRNEKKFGNYIFNELSKKGYDVFPVHPVLEEFKGKKCYPSVGSLPDDVTAIVINTKPEVTSQLVAESTAKGIRHIWLQQGAADKEFVNRLKTNGSAIITGKCIMMFTQPVKGIHGFHRWLYQIFGKSDKN
jgi:predicted CoA-binding protein